MKLSILFLLIILPGYLVSAEPFFGSFFEEIFHSVGNGLGLVGNIASSLLDGVKTATRGIYRTVFGDGSGANHPNGAVAQQLPQNPPVVSKPEAHEDEIVSKPPVDTPEETESPKTNEQETAKDENSPVSETDEPTENKSVSSTNSTDE